MDDSYLVTGEMVPLNVDAELERYNSNGCGIEATFWEVKDATNS